MEKKILLPEIHCYKLKTNETVELLSTPKSKQTFSNTRNSATLTVNKNDFDNIQPKKKFDEKTILLRKVETFNINLFYF